MFSISRMLLTLSLLAISFPALSDVEELNLKFRGNHVQVFEGDQELVDAPCELMNRLPNGSLYQCRGEDIKILELSYRKDVKRGAAYLVSSEFTNGKMARFHCTRNRLLSYDCSYTKVSNPGRGGLVSPYASEVEGLDLPNASWIKKPSSREGGILRAMNPQLESDYQQLQGVGIDEVIIFKNFTERSMPDFIREIEGLRSIGIDVGAGEIGSEEVPQDLGDVLQLNFPYHAFESFRSACKMSVQALTKMRDAVKANRIAFLHCTVGEDRTGFLAGLYELLENPRRRISTAFKYEVCENGYGAGNPQKPKWPVVANIQKDMTPIFLKMAYKIKTKKLTMDQLDESVCDVDPEESSRFSRSRTYDAARYKCKTSTRYYP